MRTNLFIKAKWLLVAALATISAQMWAVTFTPSNSCATEGDWSQTSGNVTIASHGLDDASKMSVYKSQVLTVTAASGYNITGIVFTCTANGTTKYGPGCLTTTQGTYTYESSGPTGTWAGSETSVSFTASSNQVRCTQIVVTISASTTYKVIWKSNGEIINTGSTYNAVPSGTTVTPPSAPDVPSGCSGGTFMGWTANENYSANTAPSDLFTSSSPAIVADNTTFYAVFADEVTQ